MSAALRRGLLGRLGGLARQQQQQQQGRSLLQQQQRGNHDVAVHNNKYVEQWLSRREDIEREFRWTPGTVRSVVIFGLALPIAMYNAIVWRAQADDEYGGRPVRDFLWGHAEAGERKGASS